MAGWLQLEIPEGLGEDGRFDGVDADARQLAMLAQQAHDDRVQVSARVRHVLHGCPQAGAGWR